MQQSYDMPNAAASEVQRLGPALEPKELHSLVDRSLGPSGTVWHQQRQHQRQELLLQHLTAETKPSSLAYNVGALAKLGQFDAALKLMEDLAKSSNPEALAM